MAIEDRYRHQLIKLLPPGAAWSRQVGTTMHKLMGALAIEFSRVHVRAEQLIRESDPRTTSELLPEWEEMLGLPDPCAGQPETQKRRRAVVVSKYTAQGGQSIAYYKSIAKTLGFDIEIQEYRPFRAGFSRAGDALTNDTWQFRFLVRVPEGTETTEFSAGDSVAGDPLREWGNDLLECTIKQRKPAHTEVGFAYGS